MHVASYQASALPRAFSANASPGRLHQAASPQRVRTQPLHAAHSADLATARRSGSGAQARAQQQQHHRVPLQAEVAAWQAMRLRKMVSGVCSVSPSVTLASTASSSSSEDAKPAAEADVSACDMRVGRILTCEKHPEADSLYVEQIDVGEAEPRTIVSGLVKFVPLEAMQNRLVVVICNLKPRNMRGVKSNGMVLCASNEAHDVVEPLAPPEGAKVGERVYFGQGNEQQPAPAEPNRVQKKKLWEGVQPLLRTSAARVAGFKGLDMLTSAGPVTVPTLTNASIA